MTLLLLIRHGENEYARTGKLPGRIPGVHLNSQCQLRVVNALERIVRKHDKPEDVVAVVCHSDPIKLAVAHFMGIPLDHFQRLGCDTGSLTALRIHATGAQLVKLNQHPPFQFLPQTKQNGQRIMMPPTFCRVDHRPLQTQKELSCTKVLKRSFSARIRAFSPRRRAISAREAAPQPQVRPGQLTAESRSPSIRAERSNHP